MLELLSESPAAFIAVVFAFALLFGSFLNVVIYRLPRGRSIVSPPSRCPSWAAGASS